MNTFKLEEQVVTGVSSLLCDGCPPAIARFVIAVVVNSFQSQTIRSISHVPQKLRERHPFVMDLDSPTAIMPEVPSSFVGASPNHVHPAMPRFRPRKSVNSVVKFGNFYPKTTARSGSSSNQASVHHDHLSSTTAQAQASPVSFPGLDIDPRISFGNHFESSKLISNNAHSGRHGDGPFIAVNSGECSASTGPRCDYPPRI